MKKFLVLILLAIPAAAQTQSGVQYADRFFGTDICKRIEAAMEALPNTGQPIKYGQYAGQPAKTGIVDASNFKGGIQACAAGINLKYAIELRLGGYVLELKAPIDIRQAGTTILGIGWEHNPYDPYFPTDPRSGSRIQPTERDRKQSQLYQIPPRPRPRTFAGPSGTVIQAGSGFTGAAMIRVAKEMGNVNNGNRGDDVSGAKIADLQINCDGKNTNGININTVNNTDATPQASWAIFGIIDRISVYGCKKGIYSLGPYAFDWTISNSHISHNNIGIHEGAYSNAFRYMSDEIVDNTTDGIYFDTGDDVTGFGIAGVAIIGGDLEANGRNNLHFKCGGGQTDGVNIQGVYFEAHPWSRDIRFDDCPKSQYPEGGGTLYRGISITGNYMLGGGVDNDKQSPTYGQCTTNCADYAIELPTSFKVTGMEFSANTCQNYKIACIHNPSWGGTGVIGTNFNQGSAADKIMQPSKFGFTILDTLSHSASIFSQQVNFQRPVDFDKEANFHFPAYFNSTLQPASGIEPPTGANLPIWLAGPGNGINLRHTMPATSSLNQNSPKYNMLAWYWKGSSSESTQDTWSIFSVLTPPTGADPVSSLAFTHYGSRENAAEIDMTTAKKTKMKEIDALSLNVYDKGTCTMQSGSCQAQNIAGFTTPYCVGNWTGLGQMHGHLKMMISSDNTQVTPCSDDNTDTAQVTWICFGPRP